MGLTANKLKTRRRLTVSTSIKKLRHGGHTGESTKRIAMVVFDIFFPTVFKNSLLFFVKFDIIDGGHLFHKV